MDLNWSGQERIAADTATVWSFISDPAKLASCLPDVESTKVIDAHNFEATVAVALGPVRGKLKFKVVLVPHADGNHLEMKMSGGGLGSAVDLTAAVGLSGGGNGTTLLDWKGNASLRGPVATMGGRIDAQAHKVIEATFANVRKALSRG